MVGWFNCCKMLVNKTFWTHIDGMLEKTLCETPVYIL